MSDRGARRLYHGVLLKRLMDSFEADAPGTFRVLSGHDSTLLPLLLSINEEGGRLAHYAWPKFASSVIFEVWRRAADGRKFVRVLHDERAVDVAGGEVVRVDAGEEGLVRVMALDALKERGILDDALLVVTSDHGELFTEHPETVCFDHGWMTFQPDVRAVGMIRLPGGAHGGRVRPT